jgi:hypothetical protein
MKRASKFVFGAVLAGAALGLAAVTASAQDIIWRAHTTPLGLDIFWWLKR